MDLLIYVCLIALALYGLYALFRSQHNRLNFDPDELRADPVALRRTLLIVTAEHGCGSLPQIACDLDMGTNEDIAMILEALEEMEQGGILVRSPVNFRGDPVPPKDLWMWEFARGHRACMAIRP